jgi:ankyrin repeat protein
MLAIRMGHTALAYDLLLFKADVNEKLANGYSGMHMACFRHDVKALDFYIRLGANVNAQDKSGNPPLFVCLYYTSFHRGTDRLSGNKDVVFGMKNNKGQNIFHMGVLYQNEPMLQLFFKLKRDTMVKLANETDIIMGRTPLHYVMQYQFQDVLVDLAGIQSNLNVQDINGDTALHVAIKVGWLLGCRCLIQHPLHPAALDIKNNDKNTQKVLLKQNPDFYKQTKEKNMVPKKRGWMDIPCE